MSGVAHNPATQRNLLYGKKVLNSDIPHPVNLLLWLVMARTHSGTILEGRQQPAAMVAVPIDKTSSNFNHSF